MKPNATTTPKPAAPPAPPAARGQILVKKSEMSSIVREIIKEQLGAELAEFREEQLRRATENTRGMTDAAVGKPADPAGKVRSREGSEKEQATLGLVRYAKALALSGNDPSRAIETLARQGYEQTAKRFDEQLKRALSGNTLADGGLFVPPEFSQEFIEYLRNQTVIREAGARTIEVDGTLELGRQNGTATVTWGNEGQIVNASKPNFGSLKLVTKKATVITAIGNGLIRKANRSTEEIVRDDLVAAGAVESDAKLLLGDGTASTPKGLRHQIDSANVFAANGTPTVVTATNELTKMIRLAKQAKIPFKNDDGVFFMNALSEGWLLSLRDGNNNLVFKEEMLKGRLLGQKFFSTEQLPSNLGGSGTESVLMYARMNQVLVGEGPEVQVEAFPNGTYNDETGTLRSGISADETVMRLILYVDLALRHTKAGAVLTGVTWGN